MTLAIETQDLVKEYTQGSQLLRVLKKVNLKIEKGEFMAIIPIGYPEKPGHSPRKRPVDAVVKHLE